MPFAPEIFIFVNVGLVETISRAAGALQKDQNGADVPQPDWFVRNIGAARAFSGTVSIGGGGNEAQKKFATDTMKLVIDDEGIIRSFSRDITTLWPVEKSVAEVAYTTLFDDVWIDGGWQYRDGKVSPRVYTLAELVEQAERKNQPAGRGYDGNSSA